MEMIKRNANTLITIDLSDIESPQPQWGDCRAELAEMLDGIKGSVCAAITNADGTPSGIGCQAFCRNDGTITVDFGHTVESFPNPYSAASYITGILYGYMLCERHGKEDVQPVQTRRIELVGSNYYVAFDPRTYTYDIFDRRDNMCITGEVDNNVLTAALHMLFGQMEAKAVLS